MFNFFKRRRNKQLNHDLYDNSRDGQTVTEEKLDLENDNTKVDSEEILYFDHLNFKLAVIQVLMYDLEVLKPSFDIYDFADHTVKKRLILKAWKLSNLLLTILKPYLFQRNMLIRSKRFIWMVEMKSI